MKIQNLLNSNVTSTLTAGCFEVIQHETDMSLFTAGEAMSQFYMRQCNIHKKQLVAHLNGNGVILQNGAMQWISGAIKSLTDVKGVGDLFGKMIKGKVTGESTINPLYKGVGTIVCEPTYKHILLEDVGQHGGLVISDGIFLACEETVRLEVSMVKSISGALAGNQGLFNMVLKGNGVAALESPVPTPELVCVELEREDEVRVDGPYALMWDDELTMTVERSGKSLIGSAVGGEGLVNVFRGTGRLWLTTPAAAVKRVT